MAEVAMAPDAESCEEMERLNAEEGLPLPVHQGRRVLPDLVPPAQAWAENKESERLTDSRANSPGEHRRLLSPSVHRQSRLQSGLTLGVRDIRKNTKCDIANKVKLKKLTLVKSKFQKRKEKLVEVLRPPYFIITNIVILVLIHAVNLWWPQSLQAWLAWAPGPWWRQPWRLLSYGLLHANNTHLALNALMALTVGWRLEREQGWVRVGIVWVAGVVAGALGAGALQPHVNVVGASAAVYALLTAHLPNVCLRFGHIPLWWFRPLSVVVLGASEACWMLLRSSGKEVAEVAWSAHVLGAAVSVPLSFLVFTGENSSKSYIQVCRVVSVLLLVVGVMADVAYYTLWLELYPHT